MKTSQQPILDFVLENYRSFNARATRDALLAYWKHIDGGGKMFLTMAGAMSTAEPARSSAAASSGRAESTGNGGVGAAIRVRSIYDEPS